MTKGRLYLRKDVLKEPPAAGAQANHQPGFGRHVAQLATANVFRQDDRNREGQMNPVCSSKPRWAMTSTSIDHLTNSILIMALRFPACRRTR